MARFEKRGFRGRRFGPRRFGPPKPIKVGEEYDVEITEMGSKGDGIARIKNFVVFVNGTKQGDKVHIRITNVRNRFAIGEKMGASEEETEEKTTEVEEVSEETPETEKKTEIGEVEEAEDVTEEVVKEAEEESEG
jgi:predicted RNA-binding protein with TRAM domain